MKSNVNKPKKVIGSVPPIKKTFRMAGATATGALALLSALRLAPIVSEAREHKRIKTAVLQQSGIMDAKGKMSAQDESLIRTYERKFDWPKMSAHEQTNNVRRLAEMADGVTMLKRGLQEQGIVLGTKDLVNSLRSNHQSVDRATMQFSENFIWRNAKHGNTQQKRLTTMAKLFNTLPRETRIALMGTVIEKPIYPEELRKLK